jgi:hypothetical protein
MASLPAILEAILEAILGAKRRHGAVRAQSIKEIRKRPPFRLALQRPQPLLVGRGRVHRGAAIGDRMVELFEREPDDG